MAATRWTTAGSVAGGASSGTLPVQRNVREVRVDVRPGTSCTVYSANGPIADIAAGSWQAWPKGAVSADDSAVIFGATAIKIDAVTSACPYNLTGF